MKYKNLQSGFTIVELLIGLLAASIVTYAAMSLYITQHKQMIVQDQVADVQSNIRSAATVIADAVRMAGYNVPGGITSIETFNSNPDSILVTYDSGKLDDVELTHDMTQYTSDLTCQDQDISALQEYETIYIYDPVGEVGEFLEVSRILEGPARIRHDAPLSRIYLTGTKVLSLVSTRFYIDQSNPDHPNLMIQTSNGTPSVFSENVVDLNFRYYLSSGAILNQTNAWKMIRMVEIDLVARTDQPDDEFFGGYRTRSFNLKAKVRNLGF